MKKAMKKLAMLLLVSFSIIGCQEEGTYYTGKPEQEQGGNEGGSVENDSLSVGYLSLYNSDISVDTSIEELYDYEGTKTRAASGMEDYLITIKSTNLKVPVEIETTYAEFKEVASSQEGYPLTPGKYTVTVLTEPLDTKAESDIVVGDDNADLGNAKYLGESSFTIKKGEVTNIGEVVCTLCNVKSTVSLSGDLKAMFKPDDLCTEEDIPLRVNIEMGGTSYIFSGEDRDIAVYFDPSSDSETINISLSGMYNKAAGDEEPNYAKIENWKQTITGVKPGQWRKINIHVEHTNEGNVQFVVTIESWVYDEKITVDIVNLYSNSEDVIIDPELIPTIKLEGATDNNILVPTTGVVEPLVIEFGPRAGATLTEVTVTEVIALGDTPVTLWPIPAENPYAELFTVTQNPVTNKIIATATEKGMEMLRTLEDGVTGVNYTPTFNITDTRGYTAESTFSVLVGEATPPTVTWEGHDFDTRYEIVDGMELKLDITSSTGITGFTVQINSDVLTPEELASANLAQNMDLINPASEIEGGLVALGFPIKDEILNQKQIVFDITTFMPMLAALKDGNSDFVLTITNSAGKTITKTIKLSVGADTETQPTVN